jgi:uncharacterized membrane protein YhaH (DUF805 family)
MGFPEAVRSVLSQYAGFTGRARRSEYWWFVLFNVLVSMAASTLDNAIGTKLFSPLLSLALFLPGLAVAVRRLHDTDRSGWKILIGLIPIVGWIMLIVFACQDSQPGPNRFGPSPKPAAADPVWGQQPHAPSSAV